MLSTFRRFVEGSRDAGGCRAVPQRRPVRLARRVLPRGDGHANAADVASRKNGGSALGPEGGRPLRVVAQRDARRSQHAALLLQAAAVGQHEARVHVEPQHLAVADRLQEKDRACGLQRRPGAGAFQLPGTSRVQRPHERHRGRKLLDEVGDEGRQRLSVVDVGGAVQRQDGILARLNRGQGRVFVQTVGGHDGMQRQ